MSRMSCEQIAEMLVDYADGELSAEQAGGVAAHLADCFDCRRSYDALDKSLALANVIWQDSLTQSEPGRIAWRKYASVAAGIMILLAVGILWQSRLKPVEAKLTFAQIEQKIEQAGSAARLLAAVDILARSPIDTEFVKEQYSYIIQSYPDTTAAIEAKTRIK